ncbi:uncharacterized protein LOC125657895 isoform X2 [Ostrea edulis]|uniref:uncharacterized protein LOC125657895 isoform X2 n=1 Tax=Ostrea edulis TaxID=37623 RepID=UPI0024AF44A0|nr:uncharacterized protein LOC125657895 isoform X2 [Ostrea edulis]
MLSQKVIGKKNLTSGSFVNVKQRTTTDAHQHFTAMTAKTLYTSEPMIKIVNSTTLTGRALTSPELLLQRRSSTSSSGSDQSSSQTDGVDGSRSYDFRVLDRTLFTIITIPAPHQWGYYHVVDDVGHDITEIMKYDRIIRINHSDVKDSDATSFRNTLQTELKNLKKCCKHRIRMSLTLWRWRTSDIREVRVQLSFKSKNNAVSAPPPSRQIRKHGKLTLQATNVKKYIKVESGMPGTYVRFQPETETLTVAPMNKDEKQFLKWSKQMVERVVCTMICQVGDGVYDVIGDVDTKEFNLSPQKPISADNPDERFFILYELDNSYNVYEMLLYENECVKYERTEKTFQINNLGMSKSMSKRSFIEPSPSFLFDMPQLSERGVYRLRRGICCTRPQTQYLDGVKSCNEFMLESEPDTDD